MPSAKILEQKIADTAALVEKLKSAVSGVVVSYNGINVEQDTALRKTLREAGVDYRVYKNTMTGRACDEAGYAEMKNYLGGMTALAISKDDAVAPAKILKEYAEKLIQNKETDKPIAALIEPELRDVKAVKVAIKRLDAGAFEIDEATAK